MSKSYTYRCPSCGDMRSYTAAPGEVVRCTRRPPMQEGDTKPHPPCNKKMIVLR